MLIIPKAKMPKGCDDCPCWYDGTCMASEYWGHDYSLGKHAYSKTSRPDWCELQEKKPGIRLLKEHNTR